MRYLVVKSEIRVLGTMWMPVGTPTAKCMDINEDHVEDIKDGNGNITRDSVEDWLESHCGDFQVILDFWANIAVDDKDIIIDWKHEEAEMMYVDCMYPEEY